VPIASIAPSAVISAVAAAFRTQAAGLFRDVWNVAAPVVDLIGFRGIDVKAGDVENRHARFDGQRQTDT
jgi:hypothetical protein